MAPTAYHKSTRWTGLGMAIFLAGFGGFFAVIYLMGVAGVRSGLGNWAIVLAFLPMVVAVFLIAFLLKRFNRQRVGGVAAHLEGRGFQVSQNPNETDCATFASPFAHLIPSLGLTKTVTDIRWFAVEQGAGPKALLFEHRYTTGSGKTTVEYCYTVIAWSAGHGDLCDAGLAMAPWFFMGKYRNSRRRSRRKHELTSPELADVAQTWSLTGDAATALRFLKPSVRVALESSPMNEVWCMGAGWVCCSYEGTLDAENMNGFLTHSREVLVAGGR